MLKRLCLEDREDAYLWIVYKANIPTAGLLLPEPGNEHQFPHFMSDKLGTKPLRRIVVMRAPRRSALASQRHSVGRKVDSTNQDVDG